MYQPGFQVLRYVPKRSSNDKVPTQSKAIPLEQAHPAAPTALRNSRLYGNKTHLNPPAPNASADEKPPMARLSVTCAKDSELREITCNRARQTPPTNKRLKLYIPSAVAALYPNTHAYHTAKQPRLRAHSQNCNKNPPQFRDQRAFS